MLQCLWGDQDNPSEDFQLASLPEHLLDDNWHLAVFDPVQYYPIRNLVEMHGFFKQVLAWDLWVGNIVGIQVKITDFGARKGLLFPAACWGCSNVNPAFPSDRTPWLPSPLSPVLPKLCDKSKVSPCTALLPVQGCFFPQLPLTRAPLTLSDLAHSQKKLKFRSCNSRGVVMLSAAHCFAGLDTQLGSLGTNERDGCF